MARTIMDASLQPWEAYATSGKFGYPDHSMIVFHSLSQPARRARFVVRDGDKSAAEEEVATLSDAELGGLLEQAEEIK